MQIVIDIPRKTNEHLRSDYGHGYRGFYDDDRDLIMEAIYNGIVLPEGHGDLIDRDMCLEMKCRDLVDADGVTMYAVPTGNILRMNAVIPADK